MGFVNAQENEKEIDEVIIKARLKIIKERE